MLTKLFSEYKEALDKPHEKHVRCSFEDYPTGTEACQVNISSFAPCTEENEFGYAKAAPCVFLKLQPKTGWMPQYLAEKNLSQEVAKDIKENNEQDKPQVLVSDE